MSWLDLVLSAIAGGLMTLLVFQDFDPRFVIFVALSLSVAEVFVHVRWRMTVACGRCGFDPIIYKRDPARAAKHVKAFLERRREDPLAALLPPPRLPVLVKRGAATTHASSRGVADSAQTRADTVVTGQARARNGAASEALKG